MPMHLVAHLQFRASPRNKTDTKGQYCINLNKPSNNKTPRLYARRGV